MESVVIIGSGIAGLTAAVYTARASLKPVVVSGKAEGGQLMLTTDVENFPCFPEGILGPEMISRAKAQAKKFGASFVDGDVLSVERKTGSFVTATDEGKKIESKAVIVAAGASAKTLGLPSEKKYWAKGVHTCAVCDGYFYKDKEVVVVGGGDSAMEESAFLSKHASRVTIIHRRGEFKASKIMQGRTFANKKIKVIWNAEIQEILGDGSKVTAVKLKDNKTNKVTEFKTDAVFLAIGHVPNTKFLSGLVELDANGYVRAESTKTKVPGLFAAGDCADRVYRQAVTAAGTGCQAALEAERYLESL